MQSRLRSPLLCLAFAGLALLAACATPEPPPPPPPLPPIPPNIALSSAVIQDAAVYQRYIASTAAMDPNFQAPTDVSMALAHASSISAEQLLRGEIAFAAIAALQDPNYVANVRAFAADPMARRDMTTRLINNPGYAVAFRGADTAAALAISAVLPQGKRLYDAGVAVKQSAYSIQHQAWSALPVADRPARLASVKAGAMSAGVATMDEIASFRAAATGQSPMPLKTPATAEAPPYPPVIVRGLAVAALAALGDAGDESLIAMAPMMTDGPTSTCLTTAKLNLYQCLAVARPNYEDVFCLGQHAMADTGQCLMIAAGAPAPAFAPPPALTPADTTPPPAKKPVKKKVRKH